MKPDEHSWSAGQVHRSLALRYLFWWVVVTWYALMVAGHSAFSHPRQPLLVACFPPAVPFMLVGWGKLGPAMLIFVFMALVPVVWFVAVRRPAAKALRVLASSVIFVYWALVWLPLGTYAWWNVPG